MLSEVNFSKSYALIIHLSSGILISVSTHTGVWSIVHKIYSIIPLQWLANYNKGKVQTAHHDLQNTTTPGLPWVPIPNPLAVPLVCYVESTLVCYVETTQSSWLHQTQFHWALEPHALGHGVPSTWNARSSYCHRTPLKKPSLAS